MAEKRKKVFKVVFVSQGQVFEVYAKSVSQGGLFGFVEIEGAPVAPDVYAQLLQSYDEGVAEFLGLERVKPNTLGNHRMLATL